MESTLNGVHGVVSQLLLTAHLEIIAWQDNGEPPVGICKVYHDD